MSISPKLYSIAVCLLLIGGPVQGAESDLDELFHLLRHASNETDAREYENRIWLSWFESGDQIIDDWMQQAMRQCINPAAIYIAFRTSRKCQIKA